MNGGEVKFYFKGDTKELTKSVNIIDSKFSNLGKSIGSAILKGVGVASAAMVGLVGASVKSYADMEQNLGGIETLFKNSSKTVIANAKKAYETAGMSANKYMETVTSFSARLLQGLEGDTEKAAKIADTAIKDMSDNANKMGTSMEMIQNAYQGFAKQNYTMLDNLKLGYGGTASEMARLINDSGVLGNSIEVTAETVNSVSFDKMIEAIHVIQEEMGITGTTAKEADETITGSINSAVAAFDNFLSGAGTISEVVDTVVVAGKNISKAIVKMAPEIVDGIVELINNIIPMLPSLIQELLPVILQGILKLFQGIIQAFPQIVQTLINLIPQLIAFIKSTLPILINEFFNAMLTIANALIEAYPTLIPMLVDAILSLIPAIMEHLPEFIVAGIQLNMAILTGIINSVPTLINYIPKIVWSILKAFGKLPGLLFKAGVDAVLKLAASFINNAFKLGNAAKDLAKKAYDTIKEYLSIKKLKEVGKNVAKGLVDGIKNMKDFVVDKVKNFSDSILDGIKGFFGIKSPSRVMFEIGGYLDQGLINGVESMKQDIDKAFMGTLGLSPNLYGTTSNHISPNVNVTVNSSYKQDPLGQMVRDIKTFSGGAKNDYNYGTGV